MGVVVRKGKYHIDENIVYGREVMQNVFRSTLVTGTLLFVLVSPSFIHAKHGGLMPRWVNQSTDGKGNGCCGDKDCAPVSSVEVLETGEGYAHIIVDGTQGMVHDYAVRTVRLNCQQDKPQPFICVNEQFNDAKNQLQDCITIGPDGAFHFSITPACVRCVLLPECDENYS